MQPLIDGDVLLHEIGWSNEFLDPDTGEYVILDWERASEMLDKKIQIICEEVGATKPPLLFLTNSQFLTDRHNKLQKYEGEEGDLEYIPNFRYGVSVSRAYKGNRKNPKPFHFYNLTVHILSEYDTFISMNGLEADDAIATYQKNHPNTIICSRDKDLRMCDGWHYSWECGKQTSIGPVEVDKVGHLEVREDGKIIGYGLSFFYYQLLVGDSVDNIPGLPKCGPAKAMKILEGKDTEEDMFRAVRSAYHEYGYTDEYMLEQGRLLWMTTQLNEDGSPKLWEFPFG